MSKAVDKSKAGVRIIIWLTSAEADIGIVVIRWIDICVSDGWNSHNLQITSGQLFFLFFFLRFLTETKEIKLGCGFSFGWNQGRFA